MADEEFNENPMHGAAESIAQSAMKNDAVRSAVAAEAKKSAIQAVSLNKMDFSSDDPELQMTEDDVKRLNRLSYGFRIFNICVCVLMSYASVSQLLTTSSSTSTDGFAVIFIALYVFFFSVLLCCFEGAIRGVVNIIVTNFGFLYTRLGRIIFTIFFSRLVFQFW